MKKSYKDLSNISESGGNISLFTFSELLVSESYKRIVFGGRGPYIEFSENQMQSKSFYIPKNQLFRLTNPRVYYVEFRSNDESNVKLYYQLKTVTYADYNVGHFYISLFDLYLKNKVPCIKKSDEINESSKLFFELM